MINLAHAANATLTICNKQTQVHVTFKIKAPMETTDRGGLKRNTDAKIRFVSVMVGSDNESSFSYVGVMNPTAGIVTTNKSKLPADDMRVKAAAWAIKMSLKGAELPEGYELLHSGKCICCGRKLTNPDSIKTGIGPECGSRINESVPMTAQ